MLQLVRPASEHLPSYAAALETGWSPDNTRPEAAAEQLEAIARDPAAFIAGLEDREAKGPPITLPDGSRMPRLPGFRRWMWDGAFCGSIGLRWQPGTAALPPHVLGHCGYAVVPWKRRRGYATEALRLLLPEARALGLPWIDLTTDPDNAVSQRVILVNGGVLVERFAKAAAYGGEGLRFRIILDPAAASG
ncbi:GNAT family N-acetyltransferase [Roseomonas sp. CCTCC AB2023176]|uniref:GNAT family N-acetyltransferase n=1 Tax=Roseomonas sp. CCTCC AB2023176 TaxID=3342640 RepID=UPI0035DB42F8